MHAGSRMNGIITKPVAESRSCTKVNRPTQNAETCSKLVYEDFECVEYILSYSLTSYERCFRNMRQHLIS